MAEALPLTGLEQDRGEVLTPAATELPDIALPGVPSSSLLWSRILVAASILVALFTLDQLTRLIAHFWLFESLGYQDVFWTNFREGAWLYVTAFLLFLGAVIVPAWMHPVGSRARRKLAQLGMLLGSVASYFGAISYLEFLLGGHGILPGPGFQFHKVDPVFGLDIGFYVFNLPNIHIAWRFLFWASVVMLCVSIGCANAHRAADAGQPLSRLVRRLGITGTTGTQLAVAFFGLMTALGVWLSRFDLLLRDNKASSVTRGAEYLDVNGFFSTLNYINLTTLVILGITVVVCLMLRRLRDAVIGREWRSSFRRLAIALAVLVGVDFSFKALVVIRDVLFVRPNEPVIQLPYIARHVEATRAAYHIDRIEERQFMPAVPGDPMPSAESLLASPALRNAPLWPGYVSYLERWLDRQHSRRILQTGNPMVYGPTLETFQQHQKLRTYYNFVGVDNVRYNVGGEERMFVSSVRETPLYEPQPWLAYWGQRFMLFTHGWGLVMAPTSSITQRGEPDYASYDIPARTKWPEIGVTNPRVYYGEGAATMAFSNVAHMRELDYPTHQDRAQFWLPETVKTGVKMDSLLKRVVLGWRSGMFWDLVFSDLITDKTRAHYYRTPIERLEVIAPFLYYDTNPYAVTVDGKIQWIVNGMSTARTFPYSLPEEMGDKSDERSPFPRPERMVNYIEDSVKATVDAATGQIRLYKISNEPVVTALANIYPSLFAGGETMPAGVRAQLTYPPQLFHIQFDDLYVYYHMRDPMYFFNMEDMWDDADEVLGPVVDSGKAITFSFEPYAWMTQTGGQMPSSSRPVQYAMSMAFTPEKALNLRAIPIVYQDPPDYGKLAVLQVPKGRYVIGPEQADAAIDQEPYISQNFSWWTRKGLEVIRGHTTPLLVGNEVLYVEPIFLRSNQNPVPQLKKVIVVFRGKPFMADSLEQAVRDAIAGKQEALEPLSSEAIEPQQVNSSTAQQPAPSRGGAV